MLYGQGLYAEDEFIEADVTNEYDLIYNIYSEGNIAREQFTWTLSKRANLTDLFEDIATGNLTTGILQINFNDYGLQFSDNQYLINIVRNRSNTVIINNSFWYYYRIYIKEPIRTPWYLGNMSVEQIGSGGGGGVAVMPVSREKDIPTIIVDEIKDKDEKIEISILHYFEEEK